MRRARRLVSVAVAASLAVTGLSACRSAPAMAAYVDDVQITETRAQAVYDEVHNAILAAGKDSGLVDVTRADVVAALVGSELLPPLAKQHDVSLPANAQDKSYPTLLRLPPNTEYTRLYVEASLYADQLLQKVTGGPAPTDADLREVYDALIANGANVGSFAEFKGSLGAGGKQAVQAAVGVRAEIDDAAAKADLRINPRYQPADLPVWHYPAGQNGPLILLMQAPLREDDRAPVSAAPVSPAPAGAAP
jgi:hypothetical protein